MSTITSIESCATSTCAFNHDGCTAFAITVNGQGPKASCGTFVTLDARAGLPTTNGKVGACKRLECVHNSDLMCAAESIEISDKAECLSYEIR